MQRPIPEMPAPMMPILRGRGESMGRLWKGKKGGGEVLPMSMQENNVELRYLGKSEQIGECSENPTWEKKEESSKWI